MKRKKRVIIGLTGPNASGKGAAAEFLQASGFSYHSLSDIIRGELKKLGKEPTRENLIKKGNELRTRFGPAVLAKRAGEEFRGPRELVDSIRNPYEVKELRKIPEFVLLGINAPVKLRFERSLKRARGGDALTLKDFIAKEKKENTSRSTSQQLSKTLKMADTIIVNDGTVAQMKAKIRSFLKGIL